MDLLYTIGADASNFNQNVKGLAETAKKASNEVSQSLAEASQQVDRLGGAALSSSMKMMQMRSGISAARDGVLAFTVGGQAAERSLLAMGHHINSLVNETGSFKGAMQALGSSLWGPGGIILGLSVAVELFLKWKDRQKEATKTQTDFQKALEETVKTASDELSHLTILYQASQNDNLTRQQRLLAVRELQKEYPAYFGNMSKEAILAGEAAGAYDRLTNSIINSAAAKAGQDALAEQIKPLIQLQAQLQTNERQADENWARQKRRYAEEQALKAKADTTGLRKPTTPQTPGFRAFDPNMVQGRTSVAQNTGFITLQNGDEQSLEDYKKEIQNKIKDNAAAIQSMLEQYGINTLLKQQGLKDEKEKKPKKLKDEYELLTAEITENDKKIKAALVVGNDDLANGLINRNLILHNQIQIMLMNFDELEKAQDKAFHANDITSEIPKNKSESSPLGNGAADLASMNAQVIAFKKLADLKISSRAITKEYNKELKDEATAGKEIVRVFGQGLQGAFESALSGTSSFISAMGQFLTQLIEKLIAAAAAAAILAALLSVTGFASLGNFSSIFGSLSGLGSLGKVSGTTGALPTHASGGIFTSAHAGIFGEAGPEAIVTPQHLQDFAGVSGNNNSHEVTIKPFQVGPVMWFKQGVRSDKYIRRTS